MSEKHLPEGYSYNPIPKWSGVRLSQSEIHGLGLIADIDLPCCWVVGVSHIFKSEMQKMNPSIDAISPGDLIRTPLGAFLNHSEFPNCELIKFDEGFIISVQEDILEGEELTLNYHKELCGLKIS